ncbi:putative transcriptional regulatory protein, MarR family [Bradyrhizobium oligotrophicum S58]|uniref:Putative transcriptional regulatory protein, MarR family n=1 Tax=Bradyrhizobium oligotrophicum S58 TaxID=1245469 RepID=M4Z809_9BRAD|nr:MarR family winged helix-turn-helix transcriptional regulator [Bradyrhizobium oligotrophicum]BAM89734.1 putative transcriptional regulatory protein, MarR family [Bradyrhizobium oligotrophicum S58]
MRKPKALTTSRAPTTSRTPRKLKPPARPIRPPSPGEGKRGEDGYLAYLLRQAQAAARLSLDRALTSTGLTHPQFVVLTMLKAYPGLSGADLARVALLTPQTVNVIIGNLERDGAIRRTPHPVHGRVLQWDLTRHGLALLVKARRQATALERRLTGGLSRRDLATIRRWLARIAAELHQA